MGTKYTYSRTSVDYGNVFEEYTHKNHLDTYTIHFHDKVRKFLLSNNCNSSSLYELKSLCRCVFSLYVPTRFKKFHFLQPVYKVEAPIST